MSGSSLQRRLTRPLIHLALMLLHALARCIPASAVSSIGRAIGGCLYACFPSRRRVACANLRMAFPDAGAAEIHRLCRACYAHLGLSAMEFFRIPTMTPEEIDRRIIIDGREHLEAAFARDKGVVLISAHLGNWEYGHLKVAQCGYPIDMVVKRMSLPASTAMITGIRQGHGSRVIGKEDTRAIVRALKKRRIVGILCDQHSCDGIPVTFFGHPAYTTTGPATLALMTGAVVLPGFAYHQPDGTTVVHFSPELQVIKSGDRKADIAALTQEIMSVIEAAIRRAPEQWLWTHKRWKTPATGRPVETHS